MPTVKYMAPRQGFATEAESRQRDLVDSNLRLFQSDKVSGKMASWLASTFRANFKPRDSSSVGFLQSFQSNETNFEANGKSGFSERPQLIFGPVKDSDILHSQRVAPSQLSTEQANHVSRPDKVQPSNANANGQGVSPVDEDATTTIPDNAISDQTSGSQRLGSTTSKSSRPSSNTSLGPPFIKSEEEENGNVMDVIKAPTPSSPLSSLLSTAQSSTPASLRPLIQEQSAKARKDLSKTRQLRFSDLRPKTSIPLNMSTSELVQQSIHAAYSSRLNPFALHPDEYKLLRDHICKAHVTAYLNVRNRILRLWVRNPLVCVTPEEAAGCALSSKWLNLAEVAYEWLIRKGYINFGCVEAPQAFYGKVKKSRTKKPKRKTVVVIGAGMAGIGCARQLEGLFEQYHQRLAPGGEELPKVILLEGRNRIGGRVYSHPLHQQYSNTIPKGLRCTAEMGAHIITGFDHGNPLSMIIRGQLALHYYPLKDNSTIFDLDGCVVDKKRDRMVENLYNDVLDRASVYRHRASAPLTFEGDKTLIEAGKDPQENDDTPISATERERIDDEATKAGNSQVENVPGGMDKLTGKAHMVTGSRKKAPPAVAAEAMGWKLAQNVLASREMNLDAVARSSEYPTLGGAMDEAVKQYQFLLDLSPQDMRLINWHYANLEYANAINLGKLSLSGWDQDAGNEFEGEHAQVIGGYQQVPRGLWRYPSKLDLRPRKAAKKIRYDANGLPGCAAKVFCEDGEVIEADQVVLTAPLGVLKSDAIAFDPPLPLWKVGPIQRLGFGILNKVILVYEQPFWDVDQDMFGQLREAEVAGSLDQEDYVANRGRFYFFWNCIKTCGQPVLIALMAGDAAYQAENTDDHELVASVTQELARMFKQIEIPMPIETIVTRWGGDRFARGTYSYVGATSVLGDYDAMARPVGNLHFAGEATCGTHPATVHGAYISGLRAASEIIDDMLGPIEIPNPLVPISIKTDSSPRQNGQKRKAEALEHKESEMAKQARLESVENAILGAIKADLGYRPSKPGKPVSNPFLLWTKDKWAECKQRCDETRRVATGNAKAKADRNQIRAAVGQMWREASDEQKRPYMEKTNSNRQASSSYAANFDEYLAAWDEKAMEVRRKYVAEHPEALSQEEEQQMWHALGVHGPVRKAKRMSGYADDSGTEL